MAFTAKAGRPRTTTRPVCAPRLRVKVFISIRCFSLLHHGNDTGQPLGTSCDDGDSGSHDDYNGDAHEDRAQPNPQGTRGSPSPFVSHCFLFRLGEQHSMHTPRVAAGPLGPIAVMCSGPVKATRSLSHFSVFVNFASRLLVHSRTCRNNIENLHALWPQRP